MALPLLVGLSMPTDAHENVIALVASSRDTLSNLQSYLRAAGVAVRGTREIEELPELARTNIVAFVLFPDDYRWESVVAALADVSAICPDRLLILVTAHSKRFETLANGRMARTGKRSRTPSRSDESRVLIVPRPAWGWTILDVIRAHVRPEHGRASDF